MINHVFISFSTVQIYDLSQIHLQKRLKRARNNELENLKRHFQDVNLVPCRDPSKHQEIKTSGRTSKVSQHQLQQVAFFSASY